MTPHPSPEPLDSSRLLSLLQFSDGLFPAGAYAHSLGLETYAQDARVHDQPSLAAFLRAYLHGSCAPSDGIAAVCARRAAHAGNFPACLALDDKLDAMKSAAETRQASRQMGRQTLRIAREITRQDLNEPARANQTNNLLDRLAAAVETGAAPGHHAVVFGIVAASMAWPPREMAAAFLYASASALVGASLRLMPLGQTAGQRALASVRGLIAQLAQEIENKQEDDMTSFAPLLEIAAMRHESLEARLFRS